LVVVVGIGASMDSDCLDFCHFNLYILYYEMKRILLWLLVFGMFIYSLVTNDLRALAFALLFSFSFVGWDWIKQRRNR
jgi:hypothetical protein